MSARNYMPYIEGAMDHIQRIYEFNQKIDEMRMLYVSNITTNDKGLRTLEAARSATGLAHACMSVKGAYLNSYIYNNGLRMYYEERNEYTTARLAGDKLEAVDAIIDQFVVAIGEIRKCAISNEYYKIDFWEKKANEAYWDLDNYAEEITREQLKINGKEAYNQEAYNFCEEMTQQALTVVIDALFTRFGPDAYIDENGKFIKSKGYKKPDLSFLFK